MPWFTDRMLWVGGPAAGAHRGDCRGILNAGTNRCPIMFLDAVRHGALIVKGIFAIDIEYDEQASAHGRRQKHAWQQAAQAFASSCSNSAHGDRPIIYCATISQQATCL